MPPSDYQPLVYTLLSEPELISRARGVPDYEDPEARVFALARSLSVSPFWADYPTAKLIVRSAPHPVLGVGGYFDAAGKARLEALRWQLEHFLPRLRYISYEQAEAACEQLAGQLVARFDNEVLQRAWFVAVPRGGHLVLGMLAYLLRLKPSQLTLPSSPDALLIVVDDCALTGVRFGHFLEGCGANRVVFAHLYSHPDLREAIEARESQVIACLSGRDLKDYAPKHLQEEYPAWQARWLTRMGESGYWVGQPDHICFPWNEPDITQWNPVTEREERSWYFVPPELCLKNRPGRGVKPAEVQIQAEGKGPLRPSAQVLFTDLGGQIVLGHLETEESFVLDDVAADMWRAVVTHGNENEAVTSLVSDYDVDRATLRADLHAFVAELAASGLLKKHSAND